MLRLTLGLAALAVSSAALGAPARFVDYLYIEANEGGSSGGHAAIRFGDETYHFQHERPGLIRLRRDGFEQFRYAYGVLENRTMHVSRVPVTDPTYAELRRRFSERLLIERKLFAERDALRDDRALLDLLLARRRRDGPRPIDLRGAGYFFPDDTGAPPSGAVVAVRDRVRELHGPDAIVRRTEELRVELAHLRPGSIPAPEFPVDGYPHFADPFSSRYRDLVTGLAALQALGEALPLRADSRWSPDGARRLEPGERQALAAFAGRLADQLTRLLRSGRSDWGYVLLVGLARLAALEESARTGRLVLLDAFPPDSEVIPWSSVRAHRDALPGLLAEARAELERARAALRGGAPIDEAQYAAVEDSGNRVRELEAAVRERRGLRVSAERLLPSRDARWADLVDPDVADAELDREVARARDAESRFAGELERRFAYDLFARNCVSEIFATVGDALGGRLDDPWSLDFIPFVSARAVDRRWNVAKRTTLRSYRRAKLDEMYGRESRWHAWFRESNTLTSTVYDRNLDDSFFLFFTDDLVAPRPLLGVANVVAAAGAGAAGVALLPFDRGRTLAAGIRGVVFSLPELAFVNLRKGSFTYVPPAARPVDSVPGVASARW